MAAPFRIWQDCLEYNATADGSLACVPFPLCSAAERTNECILSTVNGKDYCKSGQA